MNINRQLAPGTILGNRYRVIKALGQGGMANVYLAEDLHTRTYVALKVMRDELSDDPEFIRRFATEARAAASLDHPNIVGVLDYGQDGEIRYIVQEYVQGKTLKQLIKEQGALDYHLAVPLMIQISLALDHAHKRGVIHRDMKPQNVMITSDMVAKVTDFGIARTSNANTITLTGGVAFGSVHYFSPEQARGGHVTERSDLYSLGIILYEMLTGEVPFDGESSVAVAIKQLQEMPQRPSQIISSLPKSLDNIVFKAIQKSPGNRYGSALEFVKELDAFMKNPNGKYGVVVNRSQLPEGSQLLGGHLYGSNFGKIHDVQSSINKKYRSRTRETVGVILIVILAMAFLVGGFLWLYRTFMTSEDSSSAESFVVEDYSGRKIEKVIEELSSKYGLVLDKDLLVEWVQNDVDQGNIFDQKPQANQKFIKGQDKMELKVSAGSATNKLPDITGMSKAEAESVLKEAGYHVAFIEEASNNTDKDHVIRTVPVAGSVLPQGESVNVYISTGKSTTLVPGLVGYSWADALDLLRSANLTLGSASPYKDPVAEADRIIIKQSPEANVEVRPNSMIDLTYGSAKDYENFLHPTEANLKMPSFVGKTWDVVYSEMGNWGSSAPEISVRYINEEARQNAHHTTNPQACYVLQQSVAAGTDLSSVSEIVFTLGTYSDYIGDSNDFNFPYPHDGNRQDNFPFPGGNPIVP